MKRRVKTNAEATIRQVTSTENEKEIKRARSNEANIDESDEQKNEKEKADTINLSNKGPYLFESALSKEIDKSYAGVAKEIVIDASTSQQISGNDILLELQRKKVVVEELSKEDLESFLNDFSKRRNIAADIMNKVFQEHLENQKKMIEGIMTCLLQNNILQSITTLQTKLQELSQAQILSSDLKVSENSTPSTQTVIQEEHVEVLESFDITDQRGLVEREMFEGPNLDVVRPRSPSLERSPLFERLEYDWDIRNSINQVNEEEVEISSKMLQKPLIDPFKQDTDGDTYLHLAIVQHHKSVDKLIEQMKHETLDVQNNLGQTALHLAVLLEREADVKRLVSAGASVAIMDCHGDTPLHLACQMGSHNLASNLLKRGAVLPSVGCDTALRIRNYNGESPLHISLASSMQSESQAMIHLLFNNDCDLNLRDGKTGKTCLYLALENKNFSLAEFLIDNGADVNIEAFSGSSPLHIACKAGNINIVKKLIVHNVVLTPKNSDCESPKDVALNDEIRNLLEKAMKKERRKKHQEKAQKRKGQVRK